MSQQELIERIELSIIEHICNTKIRYYKYTVTQLTADLIRVQQSLSIAKDIARLYLRAKELDSQLPVPDNQALSIVLTIAYNIGTPIDDIANAVNTFINYASKEN